MEYLKNVYGGYLVKEGEGKIVPVINQALHHEDIMCLIKHYTMKMYGRVEV